LQRSRYRCRSNSCQRVFYRKQYDISIDFSPIYCIIYQKSKRIIAIEYDYEVVTNFYAHKIKKTTEKIEKIKSEYSKNPSYKISEAIKFERELEYFNLELEKFIEGKNKSELLKTERWITSFGLNAHHKYYQVGKSAREYHEKALIILSPPNVKT
jgi:hypothetical protein